MARILVIDDDIATCNLFSRVLQKEGLEVASEKNPLVALDYFSNNNIDIVITDFYMPEMNGLELLDEIKKMKDDVDVIVMTAYATVDNAVDAMKKGAYDYLVKPLSNDDLIMSVRRVLEKRRLKRENEYLRAELAKKENFHNIIGKSAAMRNIFALIEKVADSNATAILLGESGTGKDLVARAIHNTGKRKNKNFVALNCSALPDTLLESELFGHVKGAFSGAADNKQGLMEYADGGTLFLDEIADTSPSVQAKLLRVIEDKKIRRLGENRETAVDVRIITATSKNLRKLIDDNTFREDLFYRINVFPLNMPPLRERREDIPLLVGYFLKERKRIHPSALEKLINYDWPGNVRELENMIERLVIFAGADVIMPEDLPAELNNIFRNDLDSGLSYREAKNRVLKEFHKNFISKKLMETNGNVTKAAEQIKLDRANFQRLMRRHEIVSDEYKK